MGSAPTGRTSSHRQPWAFYYIFQKSLSNWIITKYIFFTVINIEKYKEDQENNTKYTQHTQKTRNWRTPKSTWQRLSNQITSREVWFLANWTPRKWGGPSACNQDTRPAAQLIGTRLWHAPMANLWELFSETVSSKMVYAITCGKCPQQCTQVKRHKL